MFLINLDVLLEERNLSKNEFAKQVGIAQSTISAWYTKSYENISLKNLIKVSKFFDVSIDELVFGITRSDKIRTKNCYFEDLYAINEISNLLDKYKKRMKYRFSPAEGTEMYLARCKKCDELCIVYGYEQVTEIDECGKCREPIY